LSKKWTQKNESSPLRSQRGGGVFYISASDFSDILFKQSTPGLKITVVVCAGLWQCFLVRTIMSNLKASNGVQDEVRLLRAAGKRMRSSRKSILRFYAATGMYTAKGKLKPQFR
jgi:hypothetical protein